MDQQSSRPDVFLFSHPRTASNLLCRLLSDQPGWTQSAYHFQPAFKLVTDAIDRDPAGDMTCDQRKDLARLYEDGCAQLHSARHIAHVEKNKRLFAKNHAFHLWNPSELFRNACDGDGESTPFDDLDPGFLEPWKPDQAVRGNPTFVSDSFLISWMPLFLIRHPALVFDSWYRAEQNVGGINFFNKSWVLFTSFQYSRQLYDWFTSNISDEAIEGVRRIDVKRSGTPIVVDADDIIEEQGILTKLCDLCGMDSQLIRYEWEVTMPSAEALSKMSKRNVRYMRGLWSSASIDKSKSSRGLNMMLKYEQWKDEFGLLVADKLHDLVKAALPDYEYLRTRKL